MRRHTQETCLVAKPALPFAVLKRRLERRLKAMGVRIKKVRSVFGSYAARAVFCRVLVGL